MMIDLPSGFSGPYETIEAAQDFHVYQLFSPAAVFKLPDDKGYALATIRDPDMPIETVAREIKKLTGFELVSYRDPLLGIWKEYMTDD
jgi:hypothetical protein